MISFRLMRGARALAILPFVLLTACLSEAGPTLTAPEAYEQSQSGRVTLIDIRTPPEWRQTGVAEGAHRVNLHNHRGLEGFVARILAEVEGNKDAPIALICRTGNRTTEAQKVLMGQGFTKVYNVKEGMAGSDAGPGWLKRGLPVESCKQC
jgi:rhodanese-related sulfurtransferase